MIKYVPEYIYQKYEKGVFEGSFKGFALFFDIKDFTRITEALTRKGQKGAEVINRILESTFTPVINTIERQGGFVTGFAGDAFMSVFEDVPGAAIIRVFQSILLSLSESEPINEIAEGYRIDARLVVAYGEIRWIILNNDIQNEYFFFGEAIQQCNEMAETKQDVLFSKAAIKAIGYEYFEEINGTHIPRTELILAESTIQRDYHYTQETVKSFLQKSFYGLKVENEIRDISNAFIYLDKIEFSELRQAMETIEGIAERYQAFFNKLDYSDKGLLGILIFGAPRQREKTLDRMMYFALELTEVIKEVKLGISSGRVYAGFTGTPDCQEYTILGYPPNLASRLMMKASIGETLVDMFSQEMLHNRFEFEHLGEISMKGFAQKLPVYKFMGEKQCADYIEKTAFTGREEEAQQIIDKLFYISDTTHLPLIFIHGDPGIGKSRLVEEARKSVSLSRVTWCYFLCDGILKSPYAPVIRFLKEYFQYDPKIEIEQNENNFLKQWQDIAGENAELQRIESIIGQLLGYRWQDSVWELLPPKARPEQERKALVTFFTTLAQINQTAIQIEDAQWIDEDTMLFVRELCRVEGQNDLGIIICSRYQEDGSRLNCGLLYEDVLHIDLKPLKDEYSLEIINFELNLEEIPPRTSKFILRKSQGNPLFIEQISLFLKEQNYLDKQGNFQKDIELVTAFGISDIIGARIDNLTDQIRQLVYYASVLGVEFDIQVLSRMLEHDLTQDAEQVVENCIWNKLRELHYIFSQILFRDTAYSRLLDEKRKQLNLLAAESYEKIYQKEELKPYYEMIGLHFERADLLEKATSYYFKAFFVAYRDNRLNKALELAKKALYIVQNLSPIDNYRLANCYYCLGLAYFETGDYRASLDYNLKALPLFDEAKVRSTITGDILNNVGNAYSILGEYRKALDYHGKSLLMRVTELGENHPDYAMSLMHLGNIYMQTSRNSEAQEHYEHALEILLHYADKQPGKLVTCYNNIGAFYLQLENYDKAKKYLEYALPLLEKMNALDKPRGGALFRQIGSAYDGLGDFDRALEYLNKAVSIEERIFGSQHPTTAVSYDYLGRVFFKNSQQEKAEEYLLKALRIYEEYYGEHHPATADICHSLGECFYQQNEFEKARVYLERCHQNLLKIKPGDVITDEVCQRLKEVIDILGGENK
ncbi:MAG: tetratricopeptide repeat protein [Candidatus Cloacimonetes bacterium]|nr:tetratricopeptide repeat protein [Candidatus Cloacimonadota bacterium]